MLTYIIIITIRYLCFELHFLFQHTRTHVATFHDPLQYGLTDFPATRLAAISYGESITIYTHIFTHTRTHVCILWVSTRSPGYGLITLCSTCILYTVSPAYNLETIPDTRALHCTYKKQNAYNMWVGGNRVGLHITSHGCAKHDADDGSHYCNVLRVLRRVSGAAVDDW